MVGLYQDANNLNRDAVPTAKQLTSFLDKQRKREGKTFFDVVKTRENAAYQTILDLFRNAGIEFTTDSEWAQQVIAMADKLSAKPYGPNNPYNNKRKASAAVRGEIAKLVNANHYEKSGTDILLVQDKLYLIDHSSDEEFQKREKG